MSKKALLPFLLLIMLSLSSCEKVNLDLSKPNEGKEISELTIPVKDESEVTMTYDMDSDGVLRSLTALRKLKELDSDHTNWDCELNITAKRDNEQMFKYSVNNKTRYTEDGDKIGYCSTTRCENMVVRMSSYKVSTQALCGFSYVKNNNEYIALYGNVLSAEQLESQGLSSSLLDPDYAPGSYGIDGLPYSPNIVEDPTSPYRGFWILYQILESIGNPYIQEGGWFSSAYLMRISTRNRELRPIYSYKLTNTYLIVDVERPYGILHRLDLGSTSGFEKLVQQSIQDSCYFKETMFFDVSTGLLTYLDVSFKTYDGLDYWNFVSESYIYEGTFVFKTQKESNEGYEEFMKTRKEVMTSQNSYR